MPYTAFKTFTVGEILTSATLNQQIRDNGLLGPVALSTADSEIWIATGANVGEMIIMVNSGNEILTAQGGLEADLSGADGFLQIKSGVGSALKSNLSASDAPDANDDSGSGYAIGSIWIDVTNDKAYICVDAGSAAAVWVQFGIQGLTVETFETAITGVSTFNTGALSKEPKLVLVFGVAAAGVGTSANDVFFTGIATGTGSGAISAGRSTQNPVTPSVFRGSIAGDADSIGGRTTTPAGAKDTAWAEDLDVTVFSKASGITLDWSATGIGFSNIKIVVIEFE